MVLIRYYFLILNATLVLGMNVSGDILNKTSDVHVCMAETLLFRSCIKFVATLDATCTVFVERISAACIVLMHSANRHPSDVKFRVRGDSQVKSDFF